MRASNHSCIVVRLEFVGGLVALGSLLVKGNESLLVTLFFLKIHHLMIKMFLLKVTVPVVILSRCRINLVSIL